MVSSEWKPSFFCHKGGWEGLKGNSYTSLKFVFTFMYVITTHWAIMPWAKNEAEKYLWQSYLYLVLFVLDDKTEDLAYSSALLRQGFQMFTFLFTFLSIFLTWVPKVSFPGSPPKTQVRRLMMKKMQNVWLGMNTVITWSLGAREHHPSSSGGLGKRWLSSVIAKKSTDCPDHLHRLPRLTFSSFGCFLFGLTLFFPLNWQSVSILWGEETGERIWLEIWLWVFFNKFSKNLKKDLLKKSLWVTFFCFKNIECSLFHTSSWYTPFRIEKNDLILGTQPNRIIYFF